MLQRLTKCAISKLKVLAATFIHRETRPGKELSPQRVMSMAGGPETRADGK